MQPGVGNGRALMRLVGLSLASEVGCGVTPAIAAAVTLPVPFGRKLFIDAQASISVPSTLKCSHSGPPIRGFVQYGFNELG